MKDAAPVIAISAIGIVLAAMLIGVLLFTDAGNSLIDWAQVTAWKMRNVQGSPSAAQKLFAAFDALWRLTFNS